MTINKQLRLFAFLCMQQIVRDLMRDGEPLSYTRVRRVVSDRTSPAFHNKHSGDVLPESGGLHRQIQAPSDDIDGYRHTVGIRVAKCLLSS